MTPDLSARSVPLRYFTPSEANSLLPRVADQVLEARRLIGEGSDLSDVIRGGPTPGRGAPETLAIEVASLNEQARAILEGVRAQGVEVSSLEPRQLVFPALRYGLEVLLCWKEGEESVRWWHPISTGFTDRHPLGATPDDAWEWCN